MIQISSLVMGKKDSLFTWLWSSKLVVSWVGFYGFLANVIFILHPTLVIQQTMELLEGVRNQQAMMSTKGKQKQDVAIDSRLCKRYNLSVWMNCLFLLCHFLSAVLVIVVAQQRVANLGLPIPELPKGENK